MHRIINPDDFLDVDGVRVWSEERRTEAWARAFAALDATLTSLAPVSGEIIVVCGTQGSGKSTWIAAQPCRPDAVYFDAALPGAQHRRPIIEAARRHRVGASAVWIATPLEVALVRNRQRRADRIVPEASLRSVASQFEPPSPAEGFERVTRIV